MPDFWLPDWGAYVEIKATLVGIESTAIRAHSLAVEQGCPVLMFVGQPWHLEYQILELPAVEQPGNTLDIQRIWHCIAACRKCEGYCLQHLWTAWREIGTHVCGDNEKEPLTDVPRLHDAYGRARRARFEHGERP